MVKRYDAWSLKRFAAAKRHALLACFLSEAQKTILDHLVEMNAQFLTKITRRARNVFEAKHREFRRLAKDGIDTVLSAMEILLDPKRPAHTGLTDLYDQIDPERLQSALSSCREFQRLEEHGYLDEINRHYGELRRYFPAFLKLPFQGEPGSQAILGAVLIARQLNDGALRELPDEAPMNFVPASWRKSVRDPDGLWDRHLWEFALALTIRDALRSGDLYLPQSRHHVSFWNLVYDEQQWIQERSGAYQQLSLFEESDQVLSKLTEEFNTAAHALASSLADNPLASIRDGRIALRRPDTFDPPDRVKQLRRVIESLIRHIRIEDLLQEVDDRSGFTREFRPLPGYESRLSNLVPTLQAAITAHATNLGIVAMSNSTDGISVDALHEATHWFLRDSTVKAANTRLINYHHTCTMSGVWGSGTFSSSDGQRFGIQRSSLLASFYPRYFGYYDRAISVYTHISNQFSVFSTQVISCSPREALYVLDGLLENDTVLRLREHTTDTHGYTEQLFGLCYLLGFSFMPRIKDLADQQLYKLDRASSHSGLEGLFRGSVDLGLIREQWDQLVRVAASLRRRTCPVHIVLQRLVNSSPSDRLAKALTMLGRVVKTIYILRYLHEKLRRRVQVQLNRGEHRHDLARWIFFANQGEFRTGDYAEIMNKASCLSLVSNAILVWNTIEIEKVVATLRQAGESVSDDDLAMISSLLHRHVIPNGTYRFNKS